MNIFDILYEESSAEDKRVLVNNLMNDLETRYNVSLYLSHDKYSDSVIISKIVAGERSKGIGTKVMEEIISFADRYGLSVALTPSSDFGGSIKLLEKFYKQFGFKKYKDFLHKEKLSRDPKNKSTTKISAQKTS